MLEPGDAIEIEGEGAGELPCDETHLALRAFSVFAAPAFSFRFTNRIPLERGLGSSAAAIALGLVAGAAVAGVRPTVEELLDAGLELEGHADNLAAALLGGVTLAWPGGARRIADDLPLRAVVAVPDERTGTAHSRAALPESVPHADAAASAGAAALLGAAVAAGDAELFTAALADRLHEPYRLGSSPLFRELSRRPPAAAAGVTLSGSGPSVVVWTQDAGAVAAELEGRGIRALALGVAQHGASVD